MIEAKVAFIISMYDEYDVVIKTLLTINKSYRYPFIVIVKSDDEQQNSKWKTIQLLTTKWKVLPNLAPKYYKLVLPAHAVTRNFSNGFSLIGEEMDYIVALLGDTLIFNPKPLHNKALQMLKTKNVLCCAKAYGQYFHSEKSSPDKIITDRFQDENSTDFMPQLFIVNGKLFKKTNIFRNIKVTNRFTTEQCLGDHTCEYFPKKRILEKTLLLNEKNPTFCYSFTDGIKYHAVAGKPGR